MPDRNVKLLFALFALSGFTGSSRSQKAGCRARARCPKRKSRS